MAVPNIFGTATSAIPLSQLDTNFATPVTIGNTAVQLGNTVTSFGNVTLTNVTISSGNVTVSAGSNTSPSITTVGDTNTGIFFPAADTIAFSEGGVESVRIDASGNMGIGVTPSAWSSSFKALQIFSQSAFWSAGTQSFFSTNNYHDGANKYISTGYATRYYQSQGQHIWETAASGTAGNTISFTQAMTLDASGNLLVGTTSTSATSGVGFKAIINDRFAIVSAGSTGATTSLSLYSTGASAFRFFVQDSGNINATSTSITAISDISLKENVRDLETGLTQVMALKPRRFDWKSETHLQEKNIAGFIAQEVEQVLPELVYDYQYNATEIKKSLKMGDILPTLVKAIQEQQVLITALTTRITALEAK